MVREKSTHIEVVQHIIDYVKSIGFAPLGLEFSPIKGPEGNIEYLIYLQNNPTPEELALPEIDLKALVEQSHEL